MKLENSSNGFKPLTSQEMRKIDGGWWPVALAIGLYLASEFDDIKSGVRDAMAGREYNYSH